MINQPGILRLVDFDPLSLSLVPSSLLSLPVQLYTSPAQNERGNYKIQVLITDAWIRVNQIYM